MKKLIIIVIVIVLIVAAAIATLLYVNSFQKVSVVLGGDVTGASIHKVDPEKGHNHEIVGNELQKITGNTELSLQNGTYFIIPEGEKVSKEEVGFVVDGQPLTIEVKPAYSDEYLASALENEQAAIVSAITQQFPSQMKSHVVTNGALYEKADWFGGLLVSNIDNPALRDQQDYYRVILHKEGDAWKVVGTPQLVLTSAELKDTPVEILRAVNELTPTTN